MSREMDSMQGREWRRFTRRGVILGSFFLLLVLKVAFTQIVFGGVYHNTLAIATSNEESNPIEKEIKAMDQINKKLAALSFGAPVPEPVLSGIY